MKLPVRKTHHASRLRGHCSLSPEPHESPYAGYQRGLVVQLCPNPNWCSRFRDHTTAKRSVLDLETLRQRFHECIVRQSRGPYCNASSTYKHTATPLKRFLRLDGALVGTQLECPLPVGLLRVKSYTHARRLVSICAVLDPMSVVAAFLIGRSLVGSYVAARGA